MPYSQQPSLNSQGTSTMSNANSSPRGMSASDYTRIRRLQAMVEYGNEVRDNVDVTNPTPNSGYDNGYGKSKTRRSASDWTAFRASQTADYVVTKDVRQPGEGKTNTAYTLLCNCPNGPVISNIMNKSEICVKCKYLVASERTSTTVSNPWPVPGNEEWRPWCSGYHGR
jgi:hypothetical protein